MAQTLAENLNKLGQPKRVASVPQSEQLARTPGSPLPKEKSHLFKSPDRAVGESQGE